MWRSTVVLVLALLCGCAAPRPGRSSGPADAVASWYGRRHHGRPTASGVIYDMHGLTAAHPSLPLGTLVRVTNLTNDRRVVLRITDRGPFVQGRSLDVSYGAARALGMLEQGVVPVRLEVLSTTE